MEPPNVTAAPPDAQVAELRALALGALPQMFEGEAGLFSFRVRRVGDRTVREGLSRRYTAITLIGLASEPPEAAREILGGRSTREVADWMVRSAGPQDTLGDLALIAWAAQLAGARTDSISSLIADRRPGEVPCPTVELAWVLSALVAGSAETPAAGLREQVAERLRRAMSPHGLFPHHLGAAQGKGRAHVACFADLTYPVLALAQHAALTGDAQSVACAAAGARTMCRLQGEHGQWWWHYDYRAGTVVERYPVYAVHQDSMGPMALFAAARATALDFDEAIARSLAWLWRAPELDGGSLIDEPAGIIWRKVARREPRKLSRYVQAGVSRLSTRWRAPGLDTVFPPRAIDYEDRPYHLGWVLYTWPRERAARWQPHGTAA